MASQQDNKQIQIGDQIPDSTLYIHVPQEGEGCSLGPEKFQALQQAKGKNIVIFALPGAYTPVCSGQHVPGYLSLYDDFKNNGVDEIWCISVNDAYVMQAWGKDQKVGDKIKMLGDGNGDFTKAIGLGLDLQKLGYGFRSQRYSALIKDGKVLGLNIEKGNQFKVSTAEYIIEQVKQLLKK
ncbi:Thioredoxin-like fold [Pseudocohnilembus persalinus]|uniref:Thioredoxin-like fold n=1 Tax=Pseudocohnilembus persalinus TaxID=266149 RepID=A0A0V0QSC4_PSEPJ|nr:Thioredoxin-like fold [Pseudocohnilembus persalinus]|eukprot:KRX05117.1 Thioredoxin-like fold [Pseudocohnilembus persalinus]